VEGRVTEFRKRVMVRNKRVEGVALTDNDVRCIPAVFRATKRERRVRLAFAKVVCTIDLANGCRVGDCYAVRPDAHDRTIVLAILVVSHSKLSPDSSHIRT